MSQLPGINIMGESSPLNIMDPKSAPAAEMEPAGLRSFTDVDATRKSIYDSVFDSVSKLPPVANKTHTLTLGNVQWLDPEQRTKKERKDAQLKGETLGRRLKGTWSLIDNATGKVVDSRSQVVLNAPHLTEGGTFVHSGNEYALKNQQRLRSGVFTRVKDNGEIEAHANILANGPSHRYWLDPSKGVFYAKVGQANIPLLPLLQHLGATPEELRTAWGDDLYNRNYAKADASATGKIIDKFLRGKVEEGRTTESIRTAFENMKLDPEITKRTLGQPFTNMGKDTVLATTKKLLAVSRNEAEPDDRDHLAYQNFMGPEDLFSERLSKDRAGVRRQLLFKASMKGHLEGMPSSALQSQIDSALLESGLGLPLEEINPSEMLDKSTQITRMGEGGIPCHSADTEVLTRQGWKFWPAVTINDELAINVNGALDFSVPSSLHSNDFDGLLFCADTHGISYAVTPCHRLWVSTPTTKNGQQVYRDYRFVTAEELHGKKAVHQVSTGAYVGGNASPSVFIIPPAPCDKSNRATAKQEDTVIPFSVWVRFLGYYLADGCYTYAPARKEYRIELAKRRSINPGEYAQMQEVLQLMGVTFRYEQDRRFVISGKHLAAYMRQFGKAADKFVPDYIMNGNHAVRQLFFTSITAMDGRESRSNYFIYESASSRLKEQVGWLAISLGYATAYHCYSERYTSVTISQCDARGVTVQKHKQQYHQQQYNGKVYCATVPGGLLFTRHNGRTFWSGNSTDSIPDESRSVQPSHFGFVDPLRTPESAHVGVDTYLSSNVRKGKDGNIYGRFVDSRSGKPVWKTPQEVADTTVAFPNAMNMPGKRVPAMQNGKLTWVRKNQVTLVLPSMEHAFSPLNNIIPLKSMLKGQRASMASRMTSQALPLVNGESPAVQNGVPGSNGTRSYEEEYGKHMGAVKADKGGQVLSVAPDSMTVKYDNGKTEKIELHNMLPYNRKTFLHQTPTMQPGSRFTPGQLLAKSNFTDNAGAMALGVNARVAYVPWSGNNYEDAAVISESMAKRMSSLHAYQHQLEISDKTKTGRNAFISLFPAKYSKALLANIDPSGVIKPGTTVNFGDPLILAAEERENAQNKIHKQGAPSHNDASITWDHRDPGVVTDVVDGKDGPTVVVKSVHPMQVGDKLAGRYGNKGVIAAILPDHQMPTDSAGRPFEYLQNPLGTISRGNPAQLAEVKLGLIAEKLGHPVKIEDFDPNIPDRAAWVSQQMKKFGIPDTEDILDPVRGNKIPGVATGRVFLMKLHHTSESKGQGRGGGAYDAEDAPAKGGETGAKRVSVMDTNALLSHGATATLRDAGAIRGQRNEDYWLQFMQGFTPRQPQVPMVYHKFINQLKASGINVIPNGHQLNIMALTDKDVDKLAGDRNVKTGDTVQFNADLEPIEGGLFDKATTGGHHGNRWSAVRLAEPMPNPVMEDPIRSVLGLTKKKFEAVLAGQDELQPGGGSGSKAIAEALNKIDIDREMLLARQKIKAGKKSELDDAVRKLGYFKSAKTMGLHPRDWMLNRVPVLPPQFRPVNVLGGKKIPLVADANFLYRELIEANNNLAEMKGKIGDDVGNERLAVYHAFKGVTGLGDPITQQNQDRDVKGILKHIFGSSPKFGTVQRKLISSTVDNVGRAVISPNPDLDMDSVGLPEDRAFDVYSRFVVRQLRRSGMPITQALQHVKDKTPLAREVLMKEMEQRPVIINRAPVLHRFGIMAFKPQLTKGSTLQISPLITKGFGADFDGDAMQYHVPVDDAARKEALERMLPSRQLLSPADFKTPVHTPTQEYTGGLFHASTAKTTRKHTFRNKNDVRQAWHRGDISVGDLVDVLEGAK